MPPWDRYQSAVPAEGPWAKYASAVPTPTAAPSQDNSPDFLDRARGYLEQTANAPGSGIPTKLAAAVANVPISLARGIRDSAPQAFTAPRRSLTDPNFNPVSEAQNLAPYIALGPMGNAGAPVIRDAMGAAGSAIKEASPIELAPKQAPARTLEAIGKDSTGNYKIAKDAGIVIAPEPFKNFAEKTASKLKESGFDASLHPNTNAALDRIQTTAAAGAPQTLQDVEILRRVASSAVKNAANDDQAAKAWSVVKSIDGFINDLTPDHLVEGNPETAVPALKQARQDWAIKSKLEDVQDIADTAARKDDPQKYIKQQFNRITSDTDQFNRFTPDEQKIVLDIAKTGNIERLGKLAPGLDLTGIAKIGAYATGAAFNPLTLALPAVGIAAKTLGNQSRMASVRDLQNVIARGEPTQTFFDRIRWKQGAPPPPPAPMAALPSPTMFANRYGQSMRGSQAMGYAPDEMQAGRQPGTSRLFQEQKPEPQRLLAPPSYYVSRSGQAMGSAEASRFLPDEVQAGMQPGTSLLRAPETASPQLLRLPPPRMAVTPQGQAMTTEQAMRYVPDEKQAGIEPGTTRQMPPPPSYVPAPNGSLDWGVVSPEAAKATGGAVQSLPIRVLGGDAGFGLDHIPPERVKRLQDMGFKTPESFLEYVSQNHNMIVGEKNGRIGLVVSPGRGNIKNKPAHNYMVVELRPEGDHYGVTTIIPDANTNYLTSGGKKQLWRRGANPAN